MSADMDRTPEQMQEDASMWSRAGYPGVAVGRYRDAADQIQRLTAERDKMADGLRAIELKSMATGCTDWAARTACHQLARDALKP